MFLKRISENRIVRNVAALVSGTAVAQLILIGFQLILRRLYPPEVFGAFDVYLSMVSILTILSTMRYELSVVLPKDDETADNVVVGGIALSFAINVLLLLIIAIFKTPISALIDFPAQYGYWLYFIPLSTLLFSIYQFITYWLIRHSGFKAVAINKVFRRLFEGITQTAIGALKQASGLFIGDIVGNTANILSGYYQSRKRGFSFKRVSISGMRSALKRYIEFPKYQALPAILNTTSTLLPVFFINKFFAKECVGYFGLSRQILAVPIAFITASLSQVLIKEFSDRRKQSSPFTGTFLKTAFYLLCGMVPFVIVILFWGDALFAFFFSDVWTEAGVYSAILVFAFACQFIVSPLSNILTVLEKLKVLAVWQVCYFAAVAATILFKDLDIHHFLMLYTLINVVAYAIYFLLIFLACRKYDKNIRKIENSDRETTD